jgi:toxin ParE1/3/4
MHIRWTQPAVSDLTGICDYLEKHETAALAQRVAQAVYDAAHSLAPFPKKGRLGREPDTRELVIQHHPYIVVYELRADAVQILRVLHTSQQWP